MIRRIPVERLDMQKLFDPTPGTPGRIVTRHGGFLDDVDKFDAEFFGIAPHVAIRLDPQVRMQLETVWEAVEDAGLPDRALAGSNTGVYSTAMTADYWDMLRDSGKNDLHCAANAKPSATAAGLIAHHLDLRGPAMGLEATCASALLAVHLANRALRYGEIDLAVVTSANILLGLDQYLAMSEAEILSPTGRCRFGDARADGYARSEGVVAMVLKPLDRAVADGDRIYATIKGSAAVNNGRSSGIMISPSVEGQIDMLRRAYRDADVSPGEVTYVEAHGPGTPDGDVVELGALAEVLAEGRAPGTRCLVGSVKSNIGHVEAAAGLAGLLKAALVLAKRRVPATLHVTEPNPVLAQVPDSVELARQSVDLADRPAGSLVAGVSAFGLTGTNVHMVLGEAPAPVRTRATAPARVTAQARVSAQADEHPGGPLLLPLSAKSPAALRLLAGRYANVIGIRSGADPADVCFSAGARRSHHACRAAVVGRTRDALLDELRSIEAGYDSSSVLNRLEPGGEAPQVVFVFTGQGTQRDGVARELLAAQPVFRGWMSRCDAAIERRAGWSVLARLADGRPLTTEDEIQPVLWAIEVSLAALWRDWGIEPDLVIGHSMGEVAAAVTAGALSIEDGAALICLRSALLSRIDGDGAMWAVQVGAAEAALAIADQGDDVSIAAVNGDHSTTLSGDATALATVVERLRGSGVYCRQLRVGCAAHTKQVEPMADELYAALAGLRPTRAAVPLYSTVLDRELDGRELDGAYWVRNLRRPVLFAPAVRAAMARRPRTLFVEINTHSVLVPAIEDLAESAAGEQHAVASLCRDQSETATMTAGLATAYVHGCAPRWDRVYPAAGFVPVPGHPWQHRSYWVDTPNESADDAPVRPIQVEVARPAARAEDDLMHRIVKHTAHVLAMPAEQVDPSVPLLDSGLDSLLATKLSTRITEELGVRVPARRLLTRLSLVDLAAHLNQQLLAGQAS